MRITVQSREISKKEMFNMQASSVALKDMVGKTLDIDGIFQIESADENGEPRLYNYLTSGETVYSGNSTVVAGQLDDLADILADEGELHVVPIKIKTKNREALSLKIV